MPCELIFRLIVVVFVWVLQIRTKMLSTHSTLRICEGVLKMVVTDFLAMLVSPIQSSWLFNCENFVEFLSYLVT